jgi:hypothetical protein
MEQNQRNLALSQVTMYSVCCTVQHFQQPLQCHWQLTAALPNVTLPPHYTGRNMQ